jgi:hypothetical protein
LRSSFPLKVGKDYLSVSQRRRLNQIKRTIPSLAARVASFVQKHWRKLFGFIGVPGLFDLIREFGRAKAMEWIYQNLGSFGVWLASYKLAGLTMGIIIVILWVVISVLRETRSRESIILDSSGTPYQIRTVSKAWARSAVTVSFVLVMLLVYGSYRFYKITPQALLEKYPLGYVVFDVDKENSVFPYDTQYILNDWVFDWSTVKMSERKKNNQDTVWLTLPNIRSRRDPRTVIENNSVGWPKRVGPIAVNILRTPTFDMKAEILAVKPNGVMFLIGFARRTTN